MKMRLICSLLVTSVCVLSSTVAFSEEGFFEKGSRKNPYPTKAFVLACRTTNQALKEELDCHIPERYRTDDHVVFYSGDIRGYPVTCLDTNVRNIVEEASSDVKYLWMGGCKSYPDPEIPAVQRGFGDGHFPHKLSLDFNDDSTVFSLKNLDETELIGLTLPPTSSLDYEKIEVRDGRKAISSHIHYYGPEALDKTSEAIKPVCRETYKTAFMTLFHDDMEMYFYRLNNFDGLTISNDFAEQYGLESTFTKDDLVEGSCMVMMFDNPNGFYIHRSGVFDNRNITELNVAANSGIAFEDVISTVTDLPEPYQSLSLADLDMDNVTFDVGSMFYERLIAASSASYPSIAILPVLVPAILASMFPR